MKHLIVLAISLLITCFTITLSPVNAQSPPTPTPASTSPIPSGAAKADSSPAASVTPETNVAPTPQHRAARPPDDSVTSMIAQLGLFAMIVAIVWLSVFARERQRRIAHETIRLMIEKGQPVPSELFLDPKIARPRNDLHRGVVFVSAGIGIIAFFSIDHSHFWALGLIPLLMGVGYIIVWKIQGSPKNNGTSSQP